MYSAKKSDETSRVYVSKVPAEVSELGLFNAATKLVGAPPLHCYQHQPQQQESSNECLDYSTWAILEFTDQSLADEFLLKSKKYTVLEIDSELGHKKLDRFEASNKKHLSYSGPANFQEVSGFNSATKQLDGSDETPKTVDTVVGRCYKLPPSGITCADADGTNRYIQGPLMNGLIQYTRGAEFGRDESVDAFGDYLRGYYDDFNDVLKWNLKGEVEVDSQLLERKKLESSGGTQKYSQQVNYCCPESTLDSVSKSALLATSESGCFGLCWICQQVTPTCCSNCGKRFCSLFCYNLFSEHSHGNCDKRSKAAVASLWTRKLAKIFNISPTNQSKMDAHEKPVGEPLQSWSVLCHSLNACASVDRISACHSTKENIISEILPRRHVPALYASNSNLPACNQNTKLSFISRKIRDKPRDTKNLISINTGDLDYRLFNGQPIQVIIHSQRAPVVPSKTDKTPCNLIKVPTTLNMINPSHKKADSIKSQHSFSTPFIDHKRQYFSKHLLENKVVNKYKLCTDLAPPARNISSPNLQSILRKNSKTPHNKHVHFE